MPTRETNTTPKTVLVIDDDPENLRVAASYLQPYGFEVTTARNGERGLERAVAAAPDLILLDVGLPGIDGFEVCRRLATHPDTAFIPVVFMTGRAATDDKLRGFDVGGVDYVTKPVVEKELLARVRAHVGIGALRLENQRLKLLLEALTRRFSEQKPGVERERTERLAVPVDATSPLNVLSERELEIVRLLVGGLSNKQIAYELEIKPSTVSTHRRRLMDRLGIDDLPALVRLVEGCGLQP